MSDNKTDYSDHTGKYVVVSTDEKKRGVFFGKLKHFDRPNLTIVLDECQMAVMWESGTHGFPGLAERGPSDGSRISPPAPEAELVGVSCVMLASEQAIVEWKKQKWS